MFPKFSSSEIERLITKYNENPILKDCRPPPILGWEDIFDALLSDLSMAMSRHKIDIEITQIKSKWGQLRVYVDWKNQDCTDTIPQEIYNIVAIYENMSIKTCKVCGATKQQTVVESRLTFECMKHYGDRRS